jgi:hypothetical protein
LNSVLQLIGHARARVGLRRPHDRIESRSGIAGVEQIREAAPGRDRRGITQAEQVAQNGFLLLAE